MQLHALPDAPWIKGGLHQQSGRYYVACDVCKVQGLLDPGVTPDGFVAQHRQHQSASPTHLGLGDAVARVTHALGVQKPCTPCEARRRAMNGWLPNFIRRS